MLPQFFAPAHLGKQILKELAQLKHLKLEILFGS